MENHEHKFQYPFASCVICGAELIEGDYTVAMITGNWKVREVMDCGRQPHDCQACGGCTE